MKNKINAYIVGAQKAGTTSLYEWLGQHCDVFAPPAAKDFPLFSGSSVTYRARLQRMHEFYSDTETSNRKIRLGAEANFVFSEEAPLRLAKISPDCKIIFMIRRPDERCFSAWRYARERGLDERNFAEAIKAELTGDIYPIESYAGMQMNYIDHSRYHDQLKKLTEYFDNENILIVPFERLRDNSEGVMSIVCEFLRIRDDVAWNFQIANQTVGGNRSKILSNFLYRERNSLVFAVLRLFTSPAFRATVRSKMINWNRSSSVVENVKPDDDIMATIRAILTPDVKLYDQAKDRFDQLLRDRRVVPEE